MRLEIVNDSDGPFLDSYVTANKLQSIIVTNTEFQMATHVGKIWNDGEKSINIYVNMLNLVEFVCCAELYKEYYLQIISGGSWAS